MDFRRGTGTFEGSFDFSKMEMWLTMNAIVEIGVLNIDGENVYLASYTDASDGMSPLYLYSFLDEDVIRDMRKGRVDLHTGFSHPSALIFQEFENSDGSIYTREVNYRDINPEFMVQTGVFLPNAPSGS